jgi:hypothetical protein
VSLFGLSFFGRQRGGGRDFGLEEKIVAVVAADDLDDVASFDVAA